MQAKLIFILCIPNAIFAINLKIDGIIDLGPQWNYKYKILEDNSRHDETLREPVSSHEILEDRQIEIGAPKDTVPFERSHHETEKGKTNRIKKHKHRSTEENKKYFIQMDKKESYQKMDNARLSKDKRRDKIRHSVRLKDESFVEDAKEISPDKSKKFRLKSKKNDSLKYIKINKKNEDKYEVKDAEEIKHANGTNLKTNKRDGVHLHKKKRTNTDRVNVKKVKPTHIIKTTEVHEGYNDKDFMRTFKTPEIHQRGVTEINSIKPKNHLFVKKHKIKEDSVADGFIIHVYKQSLKTFDTMDNRVEGVSKSTVKTLAKEFKKKFGQFVIQTREHLIQTKSGIDRLILNSIDTSNRILKRLVNLLTTKQQAETFQRELVKQREIEYRHACSKLGICRANSAFSDFLVDALTIILTLPLDSIKQSSNALTEALKNADFSETLDKTTQSKFRNFITKLEMMPALLIKPMFAILRAVLVGKDMPMYVLNNKDLSASNNTVAIRELIKLLDENFSKTSTEKDWKSIRDQFQEWKDGKGKDILKVMEAFVKTLIGALNKMSKEVKAMVNELMKTLLAYVK